MAFFRKIEDQLVITLDHTRLVLASIGALLFVALVFLLGVLVGKALWSYSTEATMRAVGQEWQRPPPRIEERPKPAANPQYTFYEDVKKPSDSVVPNEVMKPRIDEEKQAPTQVTPTNPAPALVRAPRPEAETAGLADSLGTTTHTTLSVGQTGRSAVPAETKAAPAAKAEPTPRTRPQPQAAAAAPTPKPAPQPAPAKSGAFAVGIESYQERPKAEAAQKLLSSKGVNAEIVGAQVGGMTWYRVQAGGFATRDAADKFIRDVLKSKGFNGYVISR